MTRNPNPTPTPLPAWPANQHAARPYAACLVDKQAGQWTNLLLCSQRLSFAGLVPWSKILLVWMWEVRSWSLSCGLR